MTHESPRAYLSHPIRVRSEEPRFRDLLHPASLYYVSRRVLEGINMIFETGRDKRRCWIDPTTLAMSLVHLVTSQLISLECIYKL